ncbi:MAG TPA: hypothetical protein HA362_02500 [Nanoarchaeota archaeon]|nr:hypothetical protein [Nanoarchaeota archaeon]
METQTTNRLARCIQLIYNGNICFEGEARQLAGTNQLKTAILEDALREGASILYSDYLAMVRAGQTDYVREAMGLAERFKFSTRTLDSAIRTGAVIVSGLPTLRVGEQGGK